MDCGLGIVDWGGGRSRDEGRRGRGEGRGTRVEGRGSRVEGRGSRVEGRGTRVEGRGSREEGGVQSSEFRAGMFVIMKVHQAGGTPFASWHMQQTNLALVAPTAGVFLMDLGRFADVVHDADGAHDVIRFVEQGLGLQHHVAEFTFESDRRRFALEGIQMGGDGWMLGVL